MERDRLSAKEVEVLALIAQGHDAKSAAQKLSVSPHTIYDRLRRAREKLGVSNSREAARLIFNQSNGDALGAPKTFAQLRDVASSLPENAFEDWHASPALGDELKVPPYEASSIGLHFASRLPLRGKHERMFNASPAERLRLIGDLSSRLAIAFVSICLAGLALANLLGS